MKNTHQSEAFGFSKCSHMLWRKSSAWQCALQMYYKFSAWCFRYNYLNLCIKVMTSEFQHLHLQGLLHTSRQNLWAYWKWWLGSIGTCLNAVVMATIENRDPAHKSVCMSVCAYHCFQQILFLKSLLQWNRT
jgi:hypothetical protein